MIYDANGKRYVPPVDVSPESRLDAMADVLAADIAAHLFGQHPDDRVRELRRSVLGDATPAELSRIGGLEAWLP